MKFSAGIILSFLLFTTAQAQSVIQERMTARNECAMTSLQCSGQAPIYSGDAEIVCISAASPEWPGQVKISGISGGGQWVHPKKAAGYEKLIGYSTDCALAYPTAAGEIPVVTRNGGDTTWWVWSVEISPDGHALSLDLAGHSKNDRSKTRQRGVNLRLSGEDIVFQILHAGPGMHQIAAPYGWADFADHVCAGVAYTSSGRAPWCQADGPGYAAASAVAMKVD
jgi:hypothetical protein